MREYPHSPNKNKGLVTLKYYEARVLDSTQKHQTFFFSENHEGVTQKVYQNVTGNAIKFLVFGTDASFLEHILQYLKIYISEMACSRQD